MSSLNQSRLDLLGKLPARVRQALQKDDSEGLARALHELDAKEQRIVHEVMRELAELSIRVRVEASVNSEVLQLNSLDSDLQICHDLPEPPEPLYQMVDGERLRPPQEWEDAFHRGSGRRAEGSVVYPVWFATTRKPKQESRPSHGFTGDREPTLDRVHYGVARVFVPECHEPGSLGSSWLKRWLWTWQDDRLVLRRIEGRSEAEFWTELKEQLRQLQQPSDNGTAPGNNIRLIRESRPRP